MKDDRNHHAFLIEGPSNYNNKPATPTTQNIKPNEITKKPAKHKNISWIKLKTKEEYGWINPINVSQSMI